MINPCKHLAALLLLAAIIAFSQAAFADTPAQLGPRPFYLVNDMDEGHLKERLQKCAVENSFSKSQFSISHRGAPLQFPEHTKEGYEAASLMGAGMIECDVTFTKDRQLVCRHSQCDLATTTDILARPNLAAKCTKPFSPGAGAKCCTSDITLAEFKSLNGKMDAGNKKAKTIEGFMNATARWRTDLYAAKGTLVTHKESIALIGKAGSKFVPELKSPSVPMPYEGSYSQQDYIDQLIEEYRSAGISANDVFIQSFDLGDILQLISRHPEFGKQAVWLDARYRTDGFNPDDANSLRPTMEELALRGVKLIAPPMWVLVKLDGQGELQPTAYAKAAKKAGLDIITWTLERSGPLNGGGGWYYQTSNGAINNDGDMFTTLDVLAQKVGVKGVFSDWPATVTFYASCMGLK